ncbi:MULTISPECIES: zinc dependent phospholipase C family protein [Bacillaceae]|uniref:zinc dependent phospholipase C family protein n=1 Tax=Bacillaceae TaxID=186817 RepID=UPI001BDF4002|nr:MULTISPECIES: zinc dependent phospholipase C family protein [Bacillaceae]MDX8361978.1 zinc dependent phospholipase C family protein [Cytobacillus sp. IB215316]
MGSRIMHLLIANRIADQFSIKDKTTFLLGGIAPDAVSPKDKSHFYKGDVNDFSRSIDYEAFLQKYSSYKKSHYILGYYTHLIADHIWLKGFYLPWLKNRMENDHKIFQLYHNDFSLLNSKLLTYYGCTNELHELLLKQSEIVQLDEITENDVKEFIPYILEDMNTKQSDLNEPLQVFMFDQVVGYVETSIDLGIQKIKSLIQ